MTLCNPDRRQRVSTWHALMDMKLGTDDTRLERIRADHAACRWADCLHLAAFAAHEDRMRAAGRPWHCEPAIRHQRPERE